jgi:hypothetical protein
MLLSGKRSNEFTFSSSDMLTEPLEIFTNTSGLGKPRTLYIYQTEIKKKNTNILVIQEPLCFNGR